MPRCWFLPANGSNEHNYLYVTKTRPERVDKNKDSPTYGQTLPADANPNPEELIHEFGTRPNLQLRAESARTNGRRGADKTREMWEEARELAREGRFDEIPADLYVRHMRNFHLIYREERNKRTPITDFTLKPWQQELLDIIVGPVDPRKIYWYWEETGGVGKSWFATFLMRNHEAVVVSSGKSADIAFLLDQPRIVCFDICRDGIDHVNFGIMEDIKNGRVFSPKYESAVKSFDIPHVVVFANCPPPHGKFSRDRIDESTVDLSNWDIMHGYRERPTYDPTAAPPALAASRVPGFTPAPAIPQPILRRSDAVPVEEHPDGTPSPLGEDPYPWGDDSLLYHRNDLDFSFTGLFDD